MSRWKNAFQKKNFEKLALILAGSLALTLVLINLEFGLLEASLYDFRMARGFIRPADSRIVLVALDDETTKSLNELAPLSMDFHARFMEALETLEPAGIGYLVDLNRVQQNSPEHFEKEWGQRFVDSALRLQTRGTPVLLGTSFDVLGERVPPFPLSSLPHAVAIIHKDGNVFAEDKVTRRALVSLNGRPVFHLELARKLGLVPSERKPRGTFEVPEVDGDYFFFRYHGISPYRQLSFSEILNGTLAPGALRNKILLVSTVSREDSTDFTFSPLAKTAFGQAKLAVHANILDSILQDDGIRRAPDWLNWLLTFAAVATVATWVLSLTPLYGVFSTLALALAVLLCGHLLFQGQGFWVRESQPLVGILVAYYLVVPYRLVREYKKRWDYQRRNEVLTQVEELKRNFLSLVTHDLKTPVARIQGLAEHLLRGTGAQQESLRNIVASTDELNHFISGILELSRLDSDRLRLQLESKDINQLIERSIEGLEHQARARGIRILSELEPLFPVRIDASLISKVLNNLIDNALKYSAADSEIHVRSRETGERIEISVRDHGIGLSEEEKARLFTRFYRAKNEMTAKVPGSGLGLYLTKYFIEAHSGSIEVESEKDAGSTFRILLPLEGAAGEVHAAIPRPLTRSRKPGIGSVLNFMRSSQKEKTPC